MSWILIRNKGEIERDALILMGASTKRDEAAKIGFFGTGFKYALAVLLRNRGEVQIWAGDRQVKLELEPVTLRGQEFKRLVVVENGTRFPTSNTVEIGPTWTAWMAVREILANAVDEGIIEVTETEHPDGVAMPGTTAILLKKEGAVEEVWRQKDELIRLDAPAVFECPLGRLYPRFGDDATRIYKNRVLVGKFEGVPALWDYDLLEVPLTEDRRVESWTAARHAERLVTRNPETARQVLEWVSQALFGTRPSVFERDFVGTYSRPSEEWLPLLEDRVLCDLEAAKWWGRDLADLHLAIAVLPQDWIDAIRRTYPDKSPKTIQEALKRATMAQEVEVEIQGDRSVLKQAVKIMAWGGMKIDCPIAPVVFKDEAVLGKWDEKAQKILIAKKVLTDGVAMTLEVLIEEWAHKESGMADCTRGFQTFLVKQIVRQFRRKYAM